MNDNIGKNLKTMARVIFWLATAFIVICFLFIFITGARWMAGKIKYDNKTWDITKNTITTLQKKNVVIYKEAKQNSYGRYYQEVNKPMTMLMIFLVDLLYCGVCFVSVVLSTYILYGFGALVDNSFKNKNNLAIPIAGENSLDASTADVQKKKLKAVSNIFAITRFGGRMSEYRIDMSVMLGII